ncbi:hypothetical protein [Bacillus cereus group sp. TH152-1LC]|uniref:hypothetical protein n=1 Tax=Bacillus cereus group sp. TH152-1LC TaxID=3018060 RepID=UPI0022DF4624|nr:hypothetical protein [Bacillus cereus group sp. TH152-1LC]MDA1675469.1 hypothetical protein [Bacillus cereus group sp. TH152-1LC]
MNYNKYIQYLESTFEKSFAFSQTVALKRDSKLLEGFIYKAEEEISFNDFYSNGNENILKYAGILAGLAEKNAPLFKKLPTELDCKLQDIEQIAKKLIADDEEHKRLYEVFKLGAEFCLYIYIDEMYRYNRLDNRAKFQNILTKAKKIAELDKITAKHEFEFKKLIEQGEALIESTKSLDKKLESKNFLKRNAFYAAKNFYWSHEKGSFDDMSNLEIKSYYFRKVKEEIKMKHQLLQSEFLKASSSSNDKIKIFS